MPPLGQNLYYFTNYDNKRHLSMNKGIKGQLLIKLQDDLDHFGTLVGKMVFNMTVYKC